MVGGAFNFSIFSDVDAKASKTTSLFGLLHPEVQQETPNAGISTIRCSAKPVAL
jgi:hypothetical protein